ncbi:MAG: alpha-glucan family phosphorylase [Melioribacteraceae bacterium]|nr:alpha-glucan family phosphorylase [Melioribacteraceae bacterium]
MIEYVGSFKVVPALPKKLEPLRYIAKNLYWTWNQDAISLFRRLDKELWEATYHNPVQLLGSIKQNRLDEVAKDDGFISQMNRVNDDLKNYLKGSVWYQTKYEKKKQNYIAYFSAEFGLTECLQIYSGGLGVLAGDHLKSASDLGIPLVAVGLNYKEGYFQQYLNNDGWQQEKYDIIDYHNQPMELEKDEEGNPIKISVDFPKRKVYAQIWRIEVGRVQLYVLDTNIKENNLQDREITHGLYSGTIETRIQQEIILGIGGIRALHALGIEPKVCHMNEGHSAFLSLERIRQHQKNDGLSFEEAKNLGFYSSIFTTHTPVPAGIDIFPNELVEKYFGKFYRNELKITDSEFYKLGTILDEKEPPNFNMAHLAMNMAGFVNGVSKLHGEVSRKMWVDGFKDVPFNEIPIDYVTNGIHIRSHLSSEMETLLYRYLGDGFINSVADPDVWKSVHEIPDEELWRTHVRRRERLVAFARKRLREQIISQGGSQEEINGAGEVLDSTTLTIGFARRFATYKRATLLFRDIERLVSILSDTERPVQIIIAGKAHPHDDAGKKLIQDIFEFAKKGHLRKRIVFLENYDMNIARYMVQGCDIWLNNPRRPLEASGTSGMKIIANGGLNFSVLDGWWDEGYNREVGWRIGNGEEYRDLDYQDEVEANMLFKTLENNIVPLFYNNGNEGLPREWIKMMKNSMSQLAPVYNTHRMVQEYTEKFYLNAHKNRTELIENDWQKVKEFTQWKANLIENWDKMEFVSVSHSGNGEELKVGSKYKVTAEVKIGNLTSDDIEVQIYYGKLDNADEANENSYSKMKCIDCKSEESICKFEGSIKCGTTGEFGYTLRILPKHSLLINQFELGAIRWVSLIKE